MSDRLTLTLIWLASLVICLVLVFSYAETDHILHAQVLPHAKPLTYLYGPYLVAILGFWYFKPFPAPSPERIEAVRFWLALACTLILNLVVLYFVAAGYLRPERITLILDEINTGVKMAGYLSFLVGPANAYYFGMKKPEGI